MLSGLASLSLTAMANPPLAPAEDAESYFASSFAWAYERVGYGWGRLKRALNRAGSELAHMGAVQGPTASTAQQKLTRRHDNVMSAPPARCFLGAGGCVSGREGL